jgi:DNA (cytosine-5)-methyltransferase 1
MRIANPFYAKARQHRLPQCTYRVLDLFSGIGGFSLGLEQAGMTTVAFCEIDPFCRQVLARHWQQVPVYPDITQLTARSLYHDHIPPIDLICGGYPCQPFSVAGKQRGENDPRHLWPHMYHLIRELRPRWVICENVAGHVELGLDTVLADLDNAGYTATAFIVPACAVGLPHRRDRVWIVAHAACVRRPWTLGPDAGQPPAKLSTETLWRDLPTPFTVGDDDGIPYRMERTHALGNAVVPQIPELIGRSIIAYESAASSATPALRAA